MVPRLSALAESGADAPAALMTAGHTCPPSCSLSNRAHIRNLSLANLRPPLSRKADRSIDPRQAPSGDGRPGQRLRRQPQPAGREAGLKRADAAAPHPKMRVDKAKLVRQCWRKAYPALHPHERSEAPPPSASSMARLSRTSAAARRASTALFSTPRYSAICSRGIPAKRCRRKTSRQSRGRWRVARTRTLRSRSSGVFRRRRHSCEGRSFTGLPRCRSRWRPPLR